MHRNIVGLVAVALTSVSGVLTAGPITYSVDVTGTGSEASGGGTLTPDGAGSIVGTITTNGTLGPLASTDIISWSLLGTGPGLSVSEVSGAFGSTNSPNGTGELIASSSSLTVVNAPSSFVGWLFQSTGPSGNESIHFGQSLDDFSIELGTPNQLSYFILASVSPVVGTNVPEPTTLALIGLGLIGIGVARRRMGQNARGNSLVSRMV
jgi:hypothetical protein